MVQANNYNPNATKQNPLNAQFTVKTSKGQKFFAGIKRGAAYTKNTSVRVAKATGKGIVASGRTASKGIIAGAKTQASFRKTYFNARELSLARTEAISQRKANISALKHQRALHKTNILGTKIEKLEIKQALRSARATNKPKSRVYNPLSDRGIKHGSVKRKDSFFAGVKKQSKGGFFG